MSSIQKAIALQAAMLAAKAAGLPMPEAAAPPPEPPIDPAITIAIAKARAAAMATCNNSGSQARPNLDPSISAAAYSAIAKANATIDAASTAVGETTGFLNTMNMMTGHPRPAGMAGGGLTPGLGGGWVRPPLSPMGQMGQYGQMGYQGQMGQFAPQAKMGMAMGGLIRPTIRPGGFVPSPMGMQGMQGMGGCGGPALVRPPAKMQAVLPGGMPAMSKSAGWVAPGVVMPKMGNLPMKEISPALAALMQSLG